MEGISLTFPASADECNIIYIYIYIMNILHIQISEYDITPIMSLMLHCLVHVFQSLNGLQSRNHSNSHVKWWTLETFPTKTNIQQDQSGQMESYFTNLFPEIFGVDPVPFQKKLPIFRSKRQVISSPKMKYSLPPWSMIQGASGLSSWWLNHPFENYATLW